MKIHGVTPDFVEEMAVLGYPIETASTRCSGRGERRGGRRARAARPDSSSRSSSACPAPTATYAAVGAVLLVVAGGAGSLPAWRVTRVALQAE
jgi:hypothetical protein